MKNQEHITNSHEQQTQPEVSPELHEALQERREKAAEVEPGKHETVAEARQEALEKALTAERGKEKAPAARERSPAERRHGPISSTERNLSYKATMHEVQSHMSPVGRTFSKIIHNKVVDAVSEAVGNTVARPNAILSGAVAAFVISLVTLLIAKHYGYRLSGFEAMGAFIAGWLIGILYDFFKIMVTGKR